MMSVNHDAMWADAPPYYTITDVGLELITSQMVRLLFISKDAASVISKKISNFHSSDPRQFSSLPQSILMSSGPEEVAVFLDLD